VDDFHGVLPTILRDGGFDLTLDLMLGVILVFGLIDMPASMVVAMQIIEARANSSSGYLLASTRMLHFPSLARQQNGARDIMFAASVVGDLTPRDAECFGRVRQTQSMSPTPADELNCVRTPILLERDLPHATCTHVEIARPHDAMTTLTWLGTREYSSVAQRAKALQTMHGFGQVHIECMTVVPRHAQRVVARWLHSRDTDSFVFGDFGQHDGSSSEYSFQRAHNSGWFSPAHTSASATSRGFASPAHNSSVSIKNTAAWSLRVMTWKCGGAWSSKYISMRHRLKRLTVGIGNHVRDDEADDSAIHALVQSVHYVSCRVAP
jgi:hypothetical protein